MLRAIAEGWAAVSLPSTHPSPLLHTLLTAYELWHNVLIQVFAQQKITIQENNSTV